MPDYKRQKEKNREHRCINSVSVVKIAQRKPDNRDKICNHCHADKNCKKSKEFYAVFEPVQKQFSENKTENKNYVRDNYCQKRIRELSDDFCDFA